MRLSSWTALVSFVALVTLWPVALVSQATPKPYSPPRTPWGDPDLQGTYTNKYEQSTPLERPEQFAGRRVDDVKGAELAGILEKRNTQVIERAAGVGPLQFRDPLDVTRGSRAWLIVDPPDGKIPPLTAAARERLGPPDPFLDTGIQGIVNARQRTPSSFDDGKFESLEDLGLWDRCITRGLPGAMMPHILGNSYEIVQAPGVVSIRYELIHDVRIVPLAKPRDPSTFRQAQGRPEQGRGASASGLSRAQPRDDTRSHAPRAIEFEMGDARGYWDGNSLVIETTNFKERSTYRNARAASLRLVERFTPVAADRIEWSVTVDDPQTWTRPWTFSMPLTKTDAEPVLEFACHEGNYAVRHILSGARATDVVKRP